MGEDRLPEETSSWTFDIELAEGFRAGIPRLQAAGAPLVSLFL